MLRYIFTQTWSSNCIPGLLLSSTTCLMGIEESVCILGVDEGSLCSPRSLLRLVCSWCLHMGWQVSFHDWGFTLALATDLLFLIKSQELFLHLLNGWGRGKKKILWPMKRILKCKLQNTSLTFWRNRCPVFYVSCTFYSSFPMTKAETIHTTEPQMLTIWPFKKEFANSHFYTVRVLCFFIFNISWRPFRIIRWSYFILLEGFASRMFLFPTYHNGCSRRSDFLYITHHACLHIPPPPRP